MKSILLLSVLLLCGCTTFPSKPAWPKAPEVDSCTDLSIVANTEKLSETLSVITQNYGKYHECKARVEAWQDWYNEQKKIYEDSK